MRMHVPLATLGTLLDLPAGVTVSTVGYTDDEVLLHLEGVQLDVDGEVVTAEYSVDTHGHRTFLTFKAPEPAPAPPEQLDPPAPPVTELVGDAAGSGPAKAAGKKAGS